MTEKKFLVVIGGPTGVGKTAFAIRIAQHFHTEILSCDSRQFYQEMLIGTAKPTLEEQQGVPHHFLSHLSIHDAYSVGNFETAALELLDTLFKKHKLVVAVGGSGLYIKAICEGLDVFPDIPEDIRRAVRDLYHSQGLEALQEAVATADPDYFARVDQQNPHRLIRALEVCRATGQPFSSFRKKAVVPRFFTPIYIQLDLPRAELYTRINQRVEAMVAAGLLEEARFLYPHKNRPALQTVGYQELFDYFDGKMPLPEAIEKIKQNTRNYAKRQLTWWRRDAFWQVFHPSEVTQAIQFIQNQITA